VAGTFYGSSAAAAQLWDRMMKKKNEKQNPEKKIEHFFILHAKNPVFFPPYSEKRK